MNQQDVRDAVKNAHYASELRILQFSEEYIKKFLGYMRDEDLEEMIAKYKSMNDLYGDASE